MSEIFAGLRDELGWTVETRLAQMEEWGKRQNYRS